MAMKKILLAAVILSALCIRLDGIKWGLPSKTLTLATYHPDEAFLFQSLENMYKTRSLNPKKIALHYGTFHFYVAGAFLGAAKVLGIIHLGSRESLLSNFENVDRMYLTARLLSVFCALLSVWGIFMLTRRIYDENKALWAAFFMAFSPMSIDISHVGKLDSFLPPLVILLSWFTLNLLDNPSKKNAWLCGIASGLIASTRYNCGIFILVPLGIIYFNRYKIAFLRIFPVLFGAFLAFIATTPYALLDYKTFLAGLHHMESFVTTPTLPTFRDSRPYNLIYIFETMMPFSMSWPATVFFVLGGIFCVKKGIIPQEKTLLLGFAAFVFVFCLSSARYTHYIAPLLPVICVFAAYGLVRSLERVPKSLGVSAAIIVALFQISYAWAFNGLYSRPNTRELAGEYIMQNAGPKDSVGMVRSYFWTPGIFRQANPPIAVVKAGDDLSEYIDDVERLPTLSPAPSYFLLSENEMRSVRLYTAQNGKDYAGILESFLSQYDSPKSFELEPEIFGIRFWRRDAPWDLRLIAPRIDVYKI